MRKLFKIIALLLPLSLASCNDFFELERPPQNPWTSLEEFERVPIGLYASVFSGDNWNIPFVNYYMFKTSMGDDIAWVSDASWGYWRETDQHNQWSERNFYLLYRTISSANLALEFVEEAGGMPFEGLTPKEVTNGFNRILGEIYFMRGMAYYFLQTFYGPTYKPSGNGEESIPLRLNYPKNLEEARTPTIGTTQEIFDLILSDFERAHDLLPDQFVQGSHHPSYEVRANKFVASAMLMRLHFLRGENDQALKFANELIDNNGGLFDLTEDPIEAFNKSGVNRGREVIFYVPFFDTTLGTPHHLSVLNHTYTNERDICAWAETRMSESMMRQLDWMQDPMTETDFSIKAKADKRFQQLMAVRYPEGKAPEGGVVDGRKEISDRMSLWPYKYFRSPDNLNTNVPMIRLAEVYLTRSIIRFMENDKQGATDDLNMVKQRAWDETVGGPFVPVTASEITAEMIHLERVIEMFNEADRIEYLRALKMDIPAGDRENTAPLSFDDGKLVWAIPAEEWIYY
ncbi:RagB/SusD family nutrient uptake outer membrane protein [Persicobacter diffluens]|uniref:RagB/SusD family nutrient uptake outer membrane protein n=1 Tax=Persicobacter diffluens TaxID=981 RepID=A0AAN5AQ35_9BACT|nr:hypothetical protein PEDI_50200 [Persicobacter diffluens]